MAFGPRTTNLPKEPLPDILNTGGLPPSTFIVVGISQAEPQTVIRSANQTKIRLGNIKLIHIQKLITAHHHPQITGQRLLIKLVDRRAARLQFQARLPQKLLRFTNLFESGRAPVSQPEGVIESLAERIVSHSDADGEVVRLFMHELAVHQEERLDGRDALRTAVCGGVGVGAVEDLEER